MSSGKKHYIRQGNDCLQFRTTNSLNEDTIARVREFAKNHEMFLSEATILLLNKGLEKSEDIRVSVNTYSLDLLINKVDELLALQKNNPPLVGADCLSDIESTDSIDTATANIPLPDSKLKRDISQVKASDFYQECCFYNPGAIIKRFFVHKLYKEWCHAKGFRHQSETNFYKELESYCSTLGIFRGSVDGFSTYCNLSLTDTSLELPKTTDLEEPSEPATEPLNQPDGSALAVDNERFTSMNLDREQAIALIRTLRATLNQTQTIEKLWECKCGASAAWREAYVQFKSLTQYK